MEQIVHGRAIELYRKRLIEDREKVGILVVTIFERSARQKLLNEACRSFAPSVRIAADVSRLRLETRSLALFRDCERLGSFVGNARRGLRRSDAVNVLTAHVVRLIRRRDGSRRKE